jgi:hypothetical protein
MVLVSMPPRLSKRFIALFPDSPSLAPQLGRLFFPVFSGLPHMSEHPILRQQSEAGTAIASRLALHVGNVEIGEMP